MQKIFLIFHSSRSSTKNNNPDFELCSSFLLVFPQQHAPHHRTSPSHLLSHRFTTGPQRTSDSSFGVRVVEATEETSFCKSILAKVAAFTIFPKKIMSALSRKGRSRSKREPEKPLPPPHRPPQPREPFVNLGLHRWERQRQEWTTKDPNYVPKRTPRPPLSELEADAEQIYAALLTQNYQPLPRRVPLGELITVLQEVRELVP